MTEDFFSNSNSSRQVYSNPQPTERTEKPWAPERTIGITIVCLILAIATAIPLFNIISAAIHYKNLGLLIFVATQVGPILSIVGLWKMKRWGVYAFGISFAFWVGINLIAALGATSTPFITNLFIIVAVNPYLIPGLVVLMNYYDME